MISNNTVVKGIAIMEPRICTRNEFSKRYWKYYLLLEKEFLNIEQYLAIDEVNFSAFSIEYIKQYQTICSEIDVISKSFCKVIDSRFNGKSIPMYCKCILDNNTDFTNRVIRLKNRNITMTPWKDWSYSMVLQQDGRTKPTSNNPDWWQKYNKVKHTRTTINSSTGLPYYKLANQNNVLSALAGLFQLELYYYRLLHQTYFSNEPDMPDSPSALFEIENWGNVWTVIGEGIAIR